MKHFFYTFLLIPIAIGMFPACLVAQTYHPFPDSSAIWRMQFCIDHTQGPSPGLGIRCDYKFSYFIYGDTIINSNTYSKIYTSDIHASDTLNTKYAGAIREDSNKRVYLNIDSVAHYNNGLALCSPPNPYYNIDLLLYDYGANVGDTILYQHNDSIRIYITSIDSVLIQNTYLKRFNYAFISSPNNCGVFWATYLYNGFYYIEKIGHHNGLFAPYDIQLDMWNELLCFEDTEIAYPDSLACYSAVGINDATIKENSVAVYPNPNSGSFEFAIDAPFQQANLTIFDVTGKVIVEQKITQNNTQLNLLSHPKGMYFYQVLTDGKQVTGKIIIQ